MKKNCLHCQKSFESALWEKQKYCSIICFNSKPKSIYKGVCTHCKKAFQYKQKIKRLDDAIWCPSCAAKNLQIRHNYGISLHDFEKKKFEQGNVCAICKTATTGYKNRALSIDHCHATGKVRGLLCDDCNNVLGKVKDNVEILKNTIQYLDFYQNQFITNDWIKYYKEIVNIVASKSKDTSHKVGTILVDKVTKIILGQGFNGPPHNYPDETFDWEKDIKNEKYDIMVHSECNAIINATIVPRIHINPIVSYTNLQPCLECLKMLSQVGIKEVYYWEKYDKVNPIVYDVAKRCGIIYEQLPS